MSIKLAKVVIIWQLFQNITKGIKLPLSNAYNIVFMQFCLSDVKFAINWILTTALYNVKWLEKGTWMVPMYIYSLNSMTLFGN